MDIGKVIDEMNFSDVFQRQFSHLKLRLAICITMIILGFVGVIVTDIVPLYSWKYWLFTSIVYAVLSVLLSFVVATQHKSIPYSFVIREALHWLALILMVYLVSVFIHHGVISNVIAGIFILTLLTLTTILAAIHFDTMYFFVGMVLAVFAVASVVFVQYFMMIAIVTIAIAAILIFWQFRFRVRQK
jgi:hypothetical protein